MTKVKFLIGDTLCGFEITGHSSLDCDDEEGKLVCAAVSSAAYMTANTITEIIGDPAAIKTDEARMKLLLSAPSPASVQVLEGFRLHLQGLSDQYGNHIRIIGGAKPC